MPVTMRSIAIFPLLLLAGPLLSSGKAHDAELKKIHGTWTFIEQVMDGKNRPADQLAKLSITFTDDQWTVTNDAKVVQGGTHEIDAARKPAHIDAKVTEGEGKGGTMLGIIEVKNDQIKVYFDPEGAARPKTLTAEIGQFSAVLERVKAKQP